MSRWQRSLDLARRELGRSVVALAPGAEAAEPPDSALRLGIKDTHQIEPDLRRRLAAHPDLAWLTVDRASPGGRAVDTGLLNPLTGRPMTGSTSGGPVNILLGMLDLCVGTDGGGSVLGPALATGLAGIIGTGLGLVGPESRTSTDGYVFRPGLGIIGRNWTVARQGFLALIEAVGVPYRYAPRGLQGLRVGVPAPGAVRLPDGADMASTLAAYLTPLWEAGAVAVTLPMAGIARRDQALVTLQALADTVDLIITLEGPVDLLGLGDSVVGSFGAPGAWLQSLGGKYLLRAANLAGCTAVALPVPRLASGLVICGARGSDGADRVLAAADLLAPHIQMPPLFTRYFFAEA
jgi:Asp-tRNA(Asn)/Glu-tRNA(Gln) amidotransferase A subunit family amidase